MSSTAAAHPSSKWWSSLAVLAAGCAIAWMDTRPGWDDTGVTAGAVLLVSILAALGGLPWWAAAASCAAPLLIAELSRGPGVLIALAVAVVGAASGAGLRRLIRGAGA